MDLRDCASWIARRVLAALGTLWALATVTLFAASWTYCAVAYGIDSTQSAWFDMAATAGTTVLVFVILIDGAHDSRALHAKVDEVLRAEEAADNRLMAAEDRSEAELDALRPTET